MRFRLPRPLKGWRVFAGEVGVIVLGVLLALGAEQLASTLSLKAEAREFRRTLDHEIGLNLFAYNVRSRQSACNAKRLEDLLDWIKAAKDGHPSPGMNLHSPAILYPYRSAWDSRDGEVFNSLPAGARQKYAEFYDELRGNLDRLNEEHAAWEALRGYSISGPITTDDRRTMLREAVKAYSTEVTWSGNMPVSKAIADQLGIKPIQPDNLTKEFLDSLDDCNPVLKTGQADPAKQARSS